MLFTTPHQHWPLEQPHGVKTATGPDDGFTQNTLLVFYLKLISSPLFSELGVETVVFLFMKSFKKPRFFHLMWFYWMDQSMIQELAVLAFVHTTAQRTIWILTSVPKHKSCIASAPVN